MDRHTKRSSVAPKLVLEPVRESSRLDSYPLASGRYLIGSSPECDLVIAVSGVAPQHCLMIVGANKTIVKAISPLTWINDGPLTEAVLKHGERLILGPVELRTRRPEVSEWIDHREEEPALPAAAVSYEPPQIEELLDHARQHLQTVIDESSQPPGSWSEDLPLSEAVQIHAAAMSGAFPPAAVSADQALDTVTMVVERQEFERRELEIDERSRALDYLGTELASREQQLLSREQGVGARETQLQVGLVEAEQFEQSLIMREQALQVRIQAEDTAERLLAERSLAFENEQIRVQQLDAEARQLASKVQREALALAERASALAAQEAEVAARAESLTQQSQAIHTLAAALPVDTSAVEHREATVAKREAVLASSWSALQASRDQISTDAAQLEQRFADLIDREQEVQKRLSAFTEQSRQTEALAYEVATRLSGVEGQERSVAASLARVAEREATLQQLKTELDGRDQVLCALRSELDIREDALNQQFSQLQLDRSTLRAGQSKLQLAEQTANQRLVDLDWTRQQRTTELETELNRRRAELESQAVEWETKSTAIRDQGTLQETRQQELVLLEQRLAEREQVIEEMTRQLAGREQSVADSRKALEREREQFASASQAEAEFSLEMTRQQASLDHNRTESLLERQTLERLRAQLDEQRVQLDQEQTERAGRLPGVVDRTEIDTEWQSVAAERARLDTERRELDEARAAFQSEQHNINELEVDPTQVSDHLQALVAERDSLAVVQNDLLREQQELRAERDEVRQNRAQLQQEREQLQAIQADSVTERDTYLLERQEVITERQSLQDRERQIKNAEADIERIRQEAEQLRVEAESGQKQMTTQRGHLQEEWASLREERAEHMRSQTALDVQREDLTTLAQQLSEHGSNSDVTIPLPVATSLAPTQPPSSRPQPQQRSTVEPFPEAVAPSNGEPVSTDPELDPSEEEPDPLAGFASFSSIGSESDDVLPPEIAEIIRQAGGYSSPTPAAPQHAPHSVQTVDHSPVLTASVPQQSEIDSQEQARLRELLGRSSESFVDAASAQGGRHEGDEVVSSERSSEYPSAWNGVPVDGVWELPAGVIEESAEEYSANADREEMTGREDSDLSPRNPAEQVPVGEENANSSELRSRLSEMFGIDLGSLRQASTQKPREETVLASGIDEVPTQVLALDSESVEDTIAVDEPNVAPQEELSQALPTDPLETHDPVAAYMEQLLARTRKSKDGSHARTETIAPKPVPRPAAPVVLQEQPDSQHIEDPESRPVRTTRKLEQSDKEAIRANLDSFRSIANTQARSDVARSELGRLSLASQIKQIFLGISSGIAVLMLSTELWTTRRYRLEITAALIATAYLGYDFWKTRNRLRELESIASNEPEPRDEIAAEQIESDDVVA